MPKDDFPQHEDPAEYQALLNQISSDITQKLELIVAQFGDTLDTVPGLKNLISTIQPTLPNLNNSSNSNHEDEDEE